MPDMMPLLNFWPFTGERRIAGSVSVLTRCVRHSPDHVALPQLCQAFREGFEQ